MFLMPVLQPWCKLRAKKRVFIPSPLSTPIWTKLYKGRKILKLARSHRQLAGCALRRMQQSKNDSHHIQKTISGNSFNSSHRKVLEKCLSRIHFTWMALLCFRLIWHVYVLSFQVFASDRPNGCEYNSLNIRRTFRRDFSDIWKNRWRSSALQIIIVFFCFPWKDPACLSIMTIWNQQFCHYNIRKQLASKLFWTRPSCANFNKFTSALHI